MNNSVEGFFSITNQNRRQYVYMSFDVEKKHAGCIFFDYDDFTLQAFAKKNALNEFKNIPLINDNHDFTLKDDWSILKASDYYPYKILLTHYDNVGKVCPQYQKPVINKTFSKSVFDLVPFTYLTDTNTITVTNFTISVTNVKNDSFICRGFASTINFQNNVEQKLFTSPHIYPNPTTKFIILQFQSTKSQSAEIQIFTTTGKTLKDEKINLSVGNNANTIDISNLQPGVYFLKLITQTEKHNLEFVKQ